MLRLLRLSLWLLVAFLPGWLRGAERWAQLSLGMTAEETLAAIGQPLFRNVGRGFETWIYDHNAEVLFFGNVIGWSSPATAAAPRQTMDVWQANHGQDDFRTVLASVPPRPAGKPSRIRSESSGPARIWRPALRIPRSGLE